MPTFSSGSTWRNFHAPEEQFLPVRKHQQPLFHLKETAENKIVKIATPRRLIVSDIVNLHGICVAGWGIAQVLEVAVKPMLETGALVKLLPEWGDERFPIYAVYPSRNYVPPKVRVFIDFVSSAVSQGTRP